MKKSNTLWFLIVTAIVLTGCGSFNRYEVREDPRIIIVPATWASEPVVKTQNVEVAHAEVNNCPAFELPPFPKKPELPYSKLTSIKAGDQGAVDEIYHAHIKELRKHISTLEKTTKEAYDNYIKKCGKGAPQKVAN